MAVRAEFSTLGGVETPLFRRASIREVRGEGGEAREPRRGVREPGRGREIPSWTARSWQGTALRRRLREILTGAGATLPGSARSCQDPAAPRRRSRGATTPARRFLD